MKVRRCVFRLCILVVGVFSVVGCDMLVMIFFLRCYYFFRVVAMQKSAVFRCVFVFACCFVVLALAGMFSFVGFVVCFL